VLPDALLTVERQARDGTVRLRVRGEIDAYTAPVFRRALACEQDAHERRIELDLSQVSFMDGSALNVIEWAAHALAPRRIRLVHPSDIGASLISISGLDGNVDVLLEPHAHDEPALRVPRS
jgi:anti-sigma B factor antagonist